jgi:hypothetical protein
LYKVICQRPITSCFVLIWSNLAVLKNGGFEPFDVLAGVPQVGLVAPLETSSGDIMPVMNYRTQDGTADYGFSLEYSPTTGWRVYIIFQPYADHVELPYQSIDGAGRRYVDWSSKADNLGEAKTIASL